MNGHADSPTLQLAEGAGQQFLLAFASGLAMTSALNHQNPGIAFAAFVT